MRTVRIRVATVAALLLALGSVSVAQAQAPTNAQKSAIRQYCASDYRSMCASVPTGGRAALECLQQNMSSLSPRCQTAVSAVTGGGGGAQPARPRPSAGGERPMQACRGDYREFCGGIRPGGGRAIMCLREHASELSPGCQQSLMAMQR